MLYSYDARVYNRVPSSVFCCAERQNERQTHWLRRAVTDASVYLLTYLFIFVGRVVVVCRLLVTTVDYSFGYIHYDYFVYVPCRPTHCTPITISSRDFRCCIFCWVYSIYRFMPAHSFHIVDTAMRQIKFNTARKPEVVTSYRFFPSQASSTSGMLESEP